MTESKCGKCGGTMKEGFPLDSTHRALPAVRVGQWAEGAPEFWILRILKMKGRRTLPIRSYRCAKCGFLESYANPPGETQ